MIDTGVAGARPVVLYLARRLPGTVIGGVDLRVRGHVQALSTVARVGVLGIGGGGDPVVDGLLCWRATRPDPEVDDPTPAQLLARILRDPAGTVSAIATSERIAALRATLEEIRPTTVVVNGVGLAPFLPTIRSASTARVILDLDEVQGGLGASTRSVMPSPGLERVYRRYEQMMVAAESDAVAAVDEVWVGSEREHGLLVAQFGEGVVARTIPSVVDVAAYRHDPGRGPRSGLLFTGSLRYAPNVDAAQALVDDILPLLPGVDAVIAGHEPPLWLMDRVGPHLTVAGGVPDMRPYLWSAAAMLVPIRAGGGTRLKVIEAMAAGLPVVSTAKGVEGLGLVPGRHFLAAEEPEEFAAAATALISTPDLATSLVTAGVEEAECRFGIAAASAAAAPALV